MKKLMCVLMLTLLSPLSAALPPLWQNVAEIKAIVEDKQLGEKLQSGEAIMDIKKTETGWLITTNHHKLAVKVVYKQQPMPGPAHFALEFGPAEKL